jgi:Ca-activated chloride channel family protein
MPITKFTKWVGSPLDGLSLEDLLNDLSDLFLDSGFNFNPGRPGNSTMDMESLRQAIIEKLVEMGRIPESMMEEWLTDRESEESQKLDALVSEIIKRLVEEGWLKTERQRDAGQGDGEGYEDDAAESPQFDLTDKSIDFLGFRLLRHLLGSLGRSSLGHHETAHLSTGVEAYQVSKEYEFGDTLNLDISATLMRTVAREGLGGSLGLEYSDLMVQQTEYQSSCATVLLLDTSHSMILYGEDRFTPAKRVALALAQLIKNQYPGDALKVVLFHDSAEEIPLAELGRVRVGPYYTNTREGLRLSRRILDRQRKDMRQIIMITDGKPSALTQPDGRIYKNAFGLDPFIVAETCAEVAACRKSGIMINTFMLARDYDLVSFVRRVADICKGKAYFTTPYTLGQYVLMDYMDKKTKTIH